jgi:hypothetical protein
MKLVVKETKLSEAGPVPPATTPSGGETAVPTGTPRPAKRGLLGKIWDFFAGDAGVGGALKKREAAKKFAIDQRIPEAHANAIQKQADLLAKKHKGDIKKIMTELTPFIQSTGFVGDSKQVALAFAGAANSTRKERGAKTGQQSQNGQQQGQQTQLNQPQFAQMMVPQAPGMGNAQAQTGATQQEPQNKTPDIREIRSSLSRSPIYKALFTVPASLGGLGPTPPAPQIDPSKRVQALGIATSVIEKILKAKPADLSEAAAPVSLNILTVINSIPATAGTTPLDDPEKQALADALKKWFAEEDETTGGHKYLAPNTVIHENKLFTKRGNQFVLKG